MEDKLGQPTPARHVPVNPSQGWGVAAAVVVLAIALVSSAIYINRTRHHSPNDVLAPTRGAATH
jgi:uncharacterized membrane protein (DUF485 family)